MKCPHCGSTDLEALETRRAIYAQEGGEWVLVYQDEPGEVDLDVDCAHCGYLGYFPELVDEKEGT